MEKVKKGQKTSNCKHNYKSLTICEKDCKKDYLSTGNLSMVHFFTKEKVILFCNNCGEIIHIN